jgi:RNA polymerase sigma-70 factor (ECF subfamily)
MQQVDVSQAPNTDMLPDTELVGLAQQGSGPAFRAIMERHNRRLYRVARSVLQDDSEAEDVVQEAYVRAFGALSDFRGGSSLSTWLTRIALNEALGRRRRRRPVVDLAALETDGARDQARVIPFPGMQQDSDPEQNAARQEIRRLIERAIDDLPGPFRVVFVMRQVEEMSVAETASYLGLREETVKTRLHRARRLLRRALDEHLASALEGTFPFAGARCARITQAVLDRLALPGAPSHFTGVMVWTSLPRRASVPRRRGIMGDEEHELVRRLFAAATAILEDAHEVAISGQAEGLEARTVRLAARQLRQGARDVETLATAAIILVREPRDD